MTNILAIVILSSGFSVAVETSSGFVERSFANTPQGVEQFLDWSEPLVEKEGKNIKVCTAQVGDDPGSIMAWLLENNMRPALVSPHAYRSFAKKENLPIESAATTAKACLSVFPFIRKVG